MYFSGVLAVMGNEDEDEDEDEDVEEDATSVRLAHTTEALRGRNVPTGASEAVHQSIYRHYVFYRVFYNKKRVLYVILEYRTFVCFKSHSAGPGHLPDCVILRIEGLG